MTGTEKATGRVVALIVLLIVAAVALRGYLPGAEPPPREQPTDSGASLLAVVALVTVSLVIIAIALISRLRDRRMVPAPAGGLAESFGGMGRPTWRFLLIGLGVIVAWLLIALLLARLGAQQDVDQPATGTGSSEPRSDASAPPPPSAPPEADGNMFEYLAASTVILLLLVAAGTVVASLRQRRAAKTYLVAGDRSAPPPTTTSGPESLARAAELGLVEIGDLSREPREAIIACYAAMERALANAPGAVPQDSDTPSEVLARAVEHDALHADSATQLVDLFTEARFSPHVMNEGHREVAVQTLRLVLAEVRAVT